MAKTPIAIIGSGNIGTDLLIKIMRTSKTLEPALMVGIDPASEGLARAKELGVDVTSQGIDGLFAHPRASEIRAVFDATSAKAHLHHAPLLKERGIHALDLTPAAVGPYVVPVANLKTQLQAGEDTARNFNLVTCGGQATIPIVHAVSQVAKVRYAEIVASISSRSAGPGTRANIDEFTQTTARGLEVVGGAEHGKAIIVLNPAEPPLLMRDTVYCLYARDDNDDEGQRAQVDRSIRAVIQEVQSYVPGYRLKQAPVFEKIHTTHPDFGPFSGTKVTVFLEVEGAGHWLPTFAGNLDIMTSAAQRLGEALCEREATA